MFIVYTAIFGDSPDQLRQVPQASEGIEFHAYTESVESPAEHKTGWLLCPPHWVLPDKRRQSRKHKVLSHQLYPDKPLTLWVDGVLNPKVNPAKLVDYFKPDCSIVTFEHSERNCIYQEAEACIRMDKDNPRVIRRQMQRYKRQHYPYNNGLAETTAVLRKNLHDVRHFNEAWWHEIEMGSCRDQLSFDYAIWRSGLKYACFPDTAWQNRLFDWNSHWS